MTKEQEIKLLRQLKGDTYFNDCIGDADIEQMIINIKNDFPINHGCRFAMKEQLLEKELSAERQAHKKEILDLAEKMIKEEAGGGNALRFIEDKIGVLSTIKIKRKNKIALTETEIDYLVLEAQKHGNND